MAKNLWRRLPFKFKAIICCVGAGLFLIFLLSSMFLGGVDNFANELDASAQQTSSAFSLKWTSDGEIVDIYEFNSSETVKHTDKLYLVAKTLTTIKNISVITTSTEVAGVTVKVTALDVPITDENGTTDEVENVELLSSSLTSTTLHDLSMTTQKELPQEIMVEILFGAEISLEYISVGL